jgi:hypothetical protein
MFDITGCVVQVAAEKAAEKAKDTQEALEKAQRDEQVLEKAQKDLENSKAQKDKLKESEEDDGDEEDDEPIAEIAKKRKSTTAPVMSNNKNQPKPDSNDKAPTSEAATKKARDARRKQQIETANAELATKADQASKLVEAARNSEKRSAHRSILNAPGSQQKKPTAATKKAAVTKAAAKEAAKKPSAAEPVVSTNRTGNKRSAAEPVVSTPLAKQTKRAKSPGDQIANQRANLIILNPTAGKKTNVAKGTTVQIRYGRYGTLYNAKVTEVLNKGRVVMVCTKDKDKNIAETEFKVVRLTDEQAKSGKPSGFTKGCANVGFAVAGANDY